MGVAHDLCAPLREIVHLAEALGVGLIMMGSRGLGGGNRALMGSVSESVVRHARCPVTIVSEIRLQHLANLPRWPREPYSSSP